MQAKIHPRSQKTNLPPFKINSLGGKCFQVCASISSYTYPCQPLGVIGTTFMTQRVAANSQGCWELTKELSSISPREDCQRAQFHPQSRLPGAERPKAHYNLGLTGILFIRGKNARAIGR